MKNRVNLTIGNEVESKNGKFIIIKKEEIPKSSPKITLKCSICGKEFTIHSPWKRAKCPQCRLNKTTDSYIGKQFANYEVLSLDHIDGHIRWYKVKCLKCGDISIKNVKTICSSKIGCEKCRYINHGNGKVPTLDAVKNCIRSAYIVGARDRGLEWQLSKEDFDEIIESNCYYCGEGPTFHKSDQKCNKTGIPYYRTGVDRLDSTKGYTKENCVPCCSICNRMKSDLSNYSFLYKIKNIYEKLHLDSMCSTTIEKTSEEDGT